MSGNEPGAGARVSPEQLGYSRTMDWGMKLGLALLVATFALYLSGLLAPAVSFDALPALWKLPVDEFLRESGVRPGWHWLASYAKGDMLALSGIALLSAVSFPCLALLARDYARRGDWTYFAITVSLIGVLGVAASGWLGSH